MTPSGIDLAREGAAATKCPPATHGDIAPGRGFDPAPLVVEPVDEGTAKAVVITHHYAGTYPLASRGFGLFEFGRLVGGAVFGIPNIASSR
jgi:hypothetical protein